jgi:N-acyl-D-amino-acid deacylase
MAHDVIIRNGTVVDGTGAAGTAADVAIDRDRITAIGDLRDSIATREIDASGQVVTPGFVDLHTHLDAQIAWDPHMTSSSWHGVTTALIGNCGVTFAPVVAADRAYLAEMMESVEDIPRDAILGNLPWDWETYPEYLDSVQRMRPALNVVGLVGHCAVRYQVMGERSLTDEVPTSEELARMAAIAEESIAGGAVGYSTSRLLGHVVPDGRTVPGTLSSIGEYLAIADGMNRAGGGIFQAVLDFDTKAGHEFQLLRAMAERAGDVVFSGGVGGDAAAAPRVVDGFGAFLDDTRANVGRITSVAQTRPGGMLMGLHQVPPVAGEAWRRVMSLATIDDRLAALRDPTTRAELVTEGQTKGLWYDPAHIYSLGTGALPDFGCDSPVSLAARADRAGVHPIEIVVAELDESDGRAFFNVWFFNRNADALGDYLLLDGVCPGLGDAGAHAGQICDADAPTHFLAYWSRDRTKVSLPGAVHRLTAKPASVLGLVDRGTLRVGAFADVNVFDPGTVQSQYPEYANDFPNGKGRLFIRSTGYALTMVNGEIVTEQGRNTTARPGRVLREFHRA